MPRVSPGRVLNGPAGIYAVRREKGADGEWRVDRVIAGPREAPEEM